MLFPLVCPVCQNLLSPHNEGFVCAAHGLYARSTHGFIRFLGDEEDYFSGHWSKNQMEALPPSKLTVGKRFLEPMLQRISHGHVLDIGTGDGVHLSYLEHAAPQLECIGLDISESALATCARRVKTATLLQADAQRIPLPHASVDAAFSYGVLAYVPDPWQGLAEMVRVTKPNGLVGLWLYPKSTTLMGRLFTAVRFLVPRLSRFWQARVADVIVPFLRVLPTASGMHLGNADWAACREVVLVNIAPPHLMFPTREEVIAQLHLLGCTVIAEEKNAPITLWAIKETTPCA